MTHADIRAAIEQSAPGVGLDPNLVEAVVLVESSGRPFAWNPEPKYRYYYDVQRRRPFRRLTDAELASESPPEDFYDVLGHRGVHADAEWWGQSASWGLMQVMGAVAREQGFSRPDMPELCDVATNIRIGCKHLASFLTRASGNVEIALRAYNGGWGSRTSPQTAVYPVKVQRFLAEIRGQRA